MQEPYDVELVAALLASHERRLGSALERVALLARVERDGYSRDYRGLRVAASGRRFWIEQATLWNVQAADGTRLGQAAAFSRTSPG